MTVGPSYSLWHVNAFTTSLDGGNPAGVVLLDGAMSDDEMQGVAERLALPATAFLTKGAGDEWNICWFSPEGEIDLCGHGTLAAGHVLLEHEGSSFVALRSRKSGMLSVRTVLRAEEQNYEIALPLIETKPAQFSDAARLLGVRIKQVHRSVKGYNIFPCRDEAELRSLIPDFDGLAKLGSDQFIATARGEKSDIVSRVFKANGEDSVTGSAHAVLAPYWAAKLGRKTFTAHQASARGGDLTVRLEGEQVWLGGQCVTVKSGKEAA